MGFFQDLKEDLSNAVNQIVDDDAGKKDKSKGMDLEKIIAELPETEDEQNRHSKYAMSFDEAVVQMDDVQEEDEVVKDFEAVVQLEESVIHIDKVEKTVIKETKDQNAMILEALKEFEYMKDPDALAAEMAREDSLLAAKSELSVEDLGIEEELSVEDLGIEEEELSVEDLGIEEELSVEDIGIAEEELSVEDIGIAEEVEPTIVSMGEEKMDTNEELNTLMNQENNTKEGEKMDEKKEIAKDLLDETAVITSGMTIRGDIEAQGSADISGTIEGNVNVLGKLNITGTIKGNSKASEIFADSARVTGSITCTGSVKIGTNTVVVGDIMSTSAVVAGAVKGDIDVQGPVILDASAIVMGNIKSKSVQINNGAVIEGMCSQCYAKVNPISFFEDIKD
ncbi:MAG: polymer-forming cytoskeletal protein [Eubacteriales bacterium]